MRTSVSQRRTFIAVFMLVVAVVAASLAWVVASPVGASPDEDYHVGSMWCPPPVDETGCQISTKDGEKAVMVPQSLAKEHVTCYAFDHNNSAQCSLNASDDVLAPTVRWDDGNYPWGYYQFAHLFVQHSTNRAVLALRAVNTLLAIGLVGGIIALSDSGLRRAIGVALTAAWLPMGFYFIAGMNPSSWAMTGTFAFAAGLLAATRSAGARRVGLIACAVAGAVLACTSRGDSAFFLFVVTVALAFAVPASKRIVPEAILACVASVVGIWVMARTNVAASHLGSGNELAEYSLKHIAWLNVSSLPNYLRGFVGHLLGPGWNDVSYQGTVSYGASVVVVAVALWSLRSLTWRKALSAVTVAGAIMGVPVVIGMRGHFNNVLVYQPRYMLPLLAVFFLLWFVVADGPPFASRPQIALLLGLSAAVHSLALHIVIQRYTRGMDDQSFSMLSNLNSIVRWWWNVPVSPMTVWQVASTTYLIAVVTAVALTRPRDGARTRSECADDAVAP